MSTCYDRTGDSGAPSILLPTIQRAASVLGDAFAGGAEPLPARHLTRVSGDCECGESPEEVLEQTCQAEAWERDRGCCRFHTLTEGLPEEWKCERELREMEEEARQ